MSINNHLDACPGCFSNNIQRKFTGIDYSVSGDFFDIAECLDCSMRFTTPIPDKLQIGKYYKSANYISHTNTNDGFVNRMYHIVRRITLRFKKKDICTQSGKSSGALLDIGAGTGAFASYMVNNGWMVTGLEPDEKAREIAYKKNKISLLPIESLSELPRESFDVITLWHVLEHVHDLHKYILKLKELIKPGGIILIAVPNYTSKDSEYYNRVWAAYDLPRHLYHFSPASMRILLHRYGMNVHKILPMWFDSFYVSFLSEKYKGGSGVVGIFRGICIGIWSNLQAVFNTERCSSVIYLIKG